MKPFPALAVLLALLPILASAGTAAADVLEQPVTLPGGLGHGVLFARDDQNKSTAGVIVVHERWGLNQYALDRARLLAREGFEAIAVDLYGTGEVVQHPEDAKTLMQQALNHPDKVKARFDAAKAILRDQQFVNDQRIFAIGYGFGGGVVMNLARDGEDLAGIAVFQGDLSTDSPMQKRAFEGRIFIARGLDDPLLPNQQIAAVVDELNSAGVAYEILSFPNARHGFSNPKADEYGRRFDLPMTYDAKADRISWQALLDFLHQTPDFSPVAIQEQGADD